MSGRVYRDEVGAAVERLATLEEENAALRAELERLGAPKRRGRAWSAGAKVLLLGVAFGMTLGALTRELSCPRGHHRQSSGHGVVVFGSHGHPQDRDDRASRTP